MGIPIIVRGGGVQDAPDGRSVRVTPGITPTNEVHDALAFSETVFERSHVWNYI